MRFKQIQADFGCYLTPVAIVRANGERSETDKFYSMTTRKHINLVGIFEKIPHAKFMKMLTTLGITASGEGL
jgi:hypothetical protein